MQFTYTVIEIASKKKVVQFKIAKLHMKNDNDML